MSNAGRLDLNWGETDEMGCVKDFALTMKFETKFAVPVVVMRHQDGGASLIASAGALETICRHFGFKCPSYAKAKGSIFITRAKVQSV